MKRLLCVAAVVATLLAGGCGIPDESSVTIVDNGPSGGVSGGGDDLPPVPVRREDSDEPKTLVGNYLRAAAGDPETAADRAKAFLAPDLAAKFPAGSDIKVVRETEDSLHTPGDAEVTIKVQVIGTLKANGVLDPADPADAVPYDLRVGPVSGRDGQFIIEAPPILMMTDDALASYYSPSTIYWWNTAGSGLVPDLRYMPLSVPTVQRPTTILGWLTGAPAPWLADAVNALPQGTQLTSNVPAISNDTLQISLTAQAVPQGGDAAAALDRLRRQLQWSIRPLVPRTIEIKIGHDDAVRTVDGDYLNSNPAYRLADAPERFALYGGAIRRLRDSPHATDPVPVLKPAANKNITAAALSASATRAYAAVVTGAVDAGKLRVAQAPLGEQADLQPVSGLSGKLGTPVWAQTPDGDDASAALGLITAGGQIYSFDATGGTARRVEWQGGGPGAVESLSVAPDGHRIALVSGGRLYRAALATGGAGITLGDPEQVLAPNLKTVAAAAWISESSLAVAGMRPNDRYAVFDVSVDGAVAVTRLNDIGAAQVTYLAAYPLNPVNGERLASESYVAGGDAWDVFSEPDKIEPQHLADVTAQPNVNPTAPFYLD